jgi:myosin-crossreactive antigen
MIAIIKFQHNGRQINANAIFTFNEKEKSVVVELFMCKEELGDILLLTQINGKWQTDSTISTDFRSTYLNILNEINWICCQNNSVAKVAGEQQS